MHLYILGSIKNVKIHYQHTKRHVKHSKHQCPSCSCNSAVIHKQMHILPSIFPTLHGWGELHDSSVPFYFVWEPQKTKKAVATRLVKHKVMKMYLNHTLLGHFSMSLCSNYDIGCSTHDKPQYNSKITTQTSVSSVNATCLRTSEK